MRGDNTRQYKRALQGDALDVKFEPLGWEDTLASTGRRM